jgi:hypothetical protein
MVDVDMSLTPLKLLGGKLVYELEVFLGYQRILNPKVPKHLKEGVKGNKGF